MIRWSRPDIIWLLFGSVILGIIFAPPLLALFAANMSVAVASGAPKASFGEPISGCRATDGDTVRCGSERIRLLGIDAPELRGHCRRGRRCAPGDSVASKDHLAGLLGDGLRIERVGRDRYGRTLALMTYGAVDLSCVQIRGGHAIYRADWDDGGRVAARCPEAR